MLGKELRSAREAAGFTQESLALEAGFDRTFISILERDLQSPTVDTLVRICRVLGVRPSLLLSRIETTYRPRRRRPRRPRAGVKRHYRPARDGA